MEIKIRCVHCNHKLAMELEPGESFVVACPHCGEALRLSADSSVEMQPEIPEADAPAPAADSSVEMQPEIPEADAPAPAAGRPALQLRSRSGASPAAASTGSAAFASAVGDTVPPPSPAGAQPAYAPSPGHGGERYTCNPATADRVGRALKWTLRGILLLAVCWGAHFIWRQFLDPAGKVAWKCDLPLKSIHLVENRDGRLTLLAGDALVRVEADSGRVEQLARIAGFEKYTAPMLRLDRNQALFCTGSEVALLSLDGRQEWERAFDGRVVRLAGDGDAVAVATVKTVPKPDARNEYDVSYLRKLIVLERRDGAVRRETTLPEDDWDCDFLLAAGKMIRSRRGAEEGDAAWHLTAEALRDGEPGWKLSGPAAPDWGPVVRDGRLLFRVRNTLYAFDAGTGGKLWSLAVPGPVSAVEEAENGLLLCRGERELAAVDPATGKSPWRMQFAADWEIVAVAGGRFYVSGMTEQAPDPEAEAPKLPAAYEKLKKEDVMIREMLGAAAQRPVRYDQFFRCFDLRDGRELWHQPKLTGTLLADADRVVMLWDSATRGATAIINRSNAGDTVVEQLTMSGGDRRFSRKDPVAIAPPYWLCGDRLIAPWHDRASGAGIGRGGLVAFALK